jgi:nucleotide-binding universal stress UspA family protein
MLSTLEVPFEQEAVAVAVDAAVEGGHRLVVVNVVELEPLAYSIRFGYDQLDEDPELTRALRAPAELAAGLGVEVERLRVKTFHPVAALLELVTELRPGLLVFGPDRTRVRARVYKRAARSLRKRAACLLWLPD